MTGSIRAGKMTGEQWVFEERTTDPSSTVEGERWLRTDLASKTDQIATLRVDIGSSVVDVPVFSTGTSGSDVNESCRIRVNGATGYIPITSPADATFNYLRMQHSSSTLAFHDAVNVPLTEPNSKLFYPVDEGSGSTVKETKTGLDATLSSATWQTGAGYKDTYLNFDGGNDYVASDNQLTSISGAHTIALWTRPSETNAGCLGQIGQGNQTTSGILHFDGSVYFWGRSNDYNSSITPDVGEWQMNMVAYDGGTGVTIYYGSESTSFTSDSGTISTSFSPADAAVTWGKRHTDSDYWTGDIDIFPIWDKELSQSEAQSHFDEYKSEYGI